MSLLLLLANAGDGAGWFPLTPPPIHPILVNFTAALVPASLVSDVLGRTLRNQSLISAAWWMLVYAAAITPLTALAGWLWLRQIGDMDHPQMAVHKWLGTALALGLLGLLSWRWRIHRRTESAPSWLYLTCTAVVVAALALQGHLGGTMSFDSGGDTPAADAVNHPPAESSDQGGAQGTR
jgi:uncharacterized membrane protein